MILHLDGPEINFRQTLLGKRHWIQLKFHFVNLHLIKYQNLWEKWLRTKRVLKLLLRTVIAELLVSHPYVKELEMVIGNAKH